MTLKASIQCVVNNPVQRRSLAYERREARRQTAKLKTQLTVINEAEEASHLTDIWKKIRLKSLMKLKFRNILMKSLLKKHVRLNMQTY